MKRLFMKGLLLSLLLLAPGALPVVAGPPDHAPHYSRSGIVETGRMLRAPGPGVLYPDVERELAEREAAVPANVNMVGADDVVQKRRIDDHRVKTCNPRKETAQNETTIAVNPNDPNNLVGGVNDYRLYEPSERRYDGSGGFYRSIDGGAHWTAGFLPGLVRGNLAEPGPYESAGDPAIAAGPNNTFWYANIAFDRPGNVANGIAVSRSGDGGATWETHFVIQTPADQGANLFNDKEWIAADPSDAQTAVVTWTQFTGLGEFIVYSKTTNGGKNWSEPKKVSNQDSNQGSQVWIDDVGNTHVVWETFAGISMLAYAMMPDGSSSFNATRLLAAINDVADPFSWALFRTASFPTFVGDGKFLHVAWSNWNGANADIVYMRSTNRGATWSSPRTLAGAASDQFYPGIGANGGKVFVMFMDHSGLSGQQYHVRAVSSSNNGRTWTNARRVSKQVSNVALGNKFDYDKCLANFIGDYNSLAVGSDGVAHPMWTDIRAGNSPGDPGSGYDQDPYTARVTAP